MKVRRISFKLDSRLARQIESAAKTEGRSREGQIEWFLEVFSGIIESLAFRPMPRKYPEDRRQDVYWKLSLPLSLYRRLKAFSGSERITLVQLIRQLLWAGVEQWQRLKLPGIRKEVFRRRIVGRSLTRTSSR